MLFPERLTPEAAVARIGHRRVAVDLGQHLGQFDPLGKGQPKPEDFRPADDADVVRRGQRKRLRQRVRDLRAFGPPLAIPRDDDVAALGQQARKAVEGLAAHHHRGAERQPLEALEVLREVPGQGSVASDDPVPRAGDDQLDHACTFMPLSWPLAPA